MTFRILVLCAALSFAGCPSEPASPVYIDLVTDVVPFVEFDGIRLEIGDYEREFLPDAEANYVEGLRLDTVTLEPGTTMLTLTLFRGRQVVVSRRVVLETAESSQVVTVLLSRDCRNIACPSEETCRGGQCVDPRCRPEAPEHCTSECMSNNECATEFAECAQPICREGVCLGRDALLCPPEQYCDPTAGCRITPQTPDAGLQDMGLDTSPDVEPAGDAGAPCRVDEYVDNHRCVTCPEGTTHEEGDDPALADTVCEGDICTDIFGVLCALFVEADVHAGSGNLFGWTLALDGDTLAVGARYDSSNATGINGDRTDTSLPQAGAVYVFVRVENEWVQQAYIKASNTDGGDEFGSALALNGDTLVVGARTEDGEGFVEMIPAGGGPPGLGTDETSNSALNSGAAYIFVREGASWSQQAYLKASNTDRGDGFGWSVAVSGATVVIGSYNESSAATGVGGDETDNSASRSGAAYVFVRDGESWTQQAYIKGSDTERHHKFGWSVAVHGDVTAIASLDHGGGAGAVYIFSRTGEAWNQQTILQASESAFDDWFGHSLAIDGDTVAVGAISESSNATGVNGDASDNSAALSGAVYLFVREESTWIQQAYIKASNTDAGDRFGSSVALHGDVLAVGATGEASDATGLGGDQTRNTTAGSGAVYLFTRVAGTWSQVAYLKPETSEEGGLFGIALALDRNTIVVGGAQGQAAVRRFAPF